MLLANTTIVKKAIHTASWTIVGLFVALPTYAADILPSSLSTKIKTVTQLGTESPITITETVINILLSLVGLIVLILIIYGGITWMLAQGNEDKVTKAKDILKGALIGIIVVLSSYGIAWYIFDIIESATNAA